MTQYYTLNHLLKFLKGRDILTWYTPCDPTKDKELYTCNAGRLTNKMAILTHDAQQFKLGVIHICEAGMGPSVPMGLTGYTVIKLERPEQNRGSLMYIKNDIYPRCLRVYVSAFNNFIKT